MTYRPVGGRSGRKSQSADAVDTQRRVNSENRPPHSGLFSYEKEGHLARYGIPYRGSKSRIAGWVVDNLPPSETFIDLFAGGCAVTHAALLSEKWGSYIVNDVTDAPRLFIDAASGKYAGETRIPTRDEFFAQKDNDPYVRYLFSFSNNGRDYLFSRDLEDVKVTASRMLVEPDLETRYRLYSKFIRLLDDKLTRRQLVELESCHLMLALKRLQSLQSLQSLQLDYREVEIPSDSTVYCDPPYRGTNCGCYGGFDFDAFDEWLERCGHMVVVSEYTAPRGCIEVARREKQCSASANGKNQRVTERLFVHESHLDEYNERMSAYKPVD